MVSPGAWRSRAKAQNKAFRVILDKSLNFSESPLFICKKKLKNPCVPYRVMVRRHIRNSISAHGQMIGKQQRFWSLIFFLMWTAFTLYLSCYNSSSIVWFVFFFGFSVREHGILVPWPGIEPAPPALEGEILTTGPPRKSQQKFLSQVLFQFLCLTLEGFWKVLQRLWPCNQPVFICRKASVNQGFKEGLGYESISAHWENELQAQEGELGGWGELAGVFAPLNAHIC